MGQTVSVAQWVAGGFDAVENAALLAVLRGRTGRLPGVTATCAYAKFALIGLGWTYAGIGLIAHLRRLRRSFADTGRIERSRRLG